ncbi:MAG TPA: EAL domain-containing protein [Terracidiphilus sp.]|nr:EAL domain-containing protein [Terracidiphilus sp.]
MRRSSGIAIAVAVGSVAVVAPIWISVQLAWNEALANSQSRVESYASDLVRRGEEATRQLNRARSLLNAVHYPPCSPDEVALMQELAVTSNYIQAIGRTSGNQITCSSLTTTAPIDIGPADLVTENGSEERFNVRLFAAQVHPLLVISEGGLAFIVDSSLMEDLPVAGTGISVGIFVPSQPLHNLISTANGEISSSWLRTIPKGTSTTFVDGGYVVSVVRAQRADLAVVAASPSVYVRQQLWPFAYIYIPLGLLCSFGLAWAVARISRTGLSLPSALRRAAKRKEFYVEYQPIVDLATERWVGAEALVRWRRGGRVVMPDQFIPVAEESGVITRITACVAEIVAADLPSMLALDPEFQICMNLSEPDLVTPDTVSLLRKVMSTSNARPCNLQVEATERLFVQADQSRWMLAKIRSLGIEVAIDDFGTGYSSLSCLQTLGLDALKIDKSFVDTIGTDGATSQVVPHIISMAHSLELEMIAEGVETAAQADFLRMRGVHYAQGWLFARSMSIDSLCVALQAQQTVESPEVPA